MAAIDGRIAGIWSRMFKKDTVVISTKMFRRVKKLEKKLMRGAAEKYGTFVGKKVIIDIAG
ncbi:MAG TPA: hypothetical protein VLX91_01445 [Candidatus Acidoferrales bacterium]|nr:hypothetical protein [Candidatus Acidoferrales bacterium]